MKKFEYKILEVPAGGFWGGKVDYQQLTEKLNDLGREGWEVVNSTDTQLYSSATRSLGIILKREISL